MLTLLLGTDWTANRDKILSMIAEDVSHEKSGRILMVPELISHDTERRLCEVAGDTCSRFAEVLSFTRLANRVADGVGHAALDCLDNGGRVVAMAAAVRQLHTRLKAYAAMETRPEFLISLVDAVDEFKRCNICAGDLMLASKETQGVLAQKLEELSLILESYDCLCQHGKRDPRDQMTWLLSELEEGSFGENHVFYVDGFPDFTRQHMAILMYLIRVSERVVVSLNCDAPGSKIMAFEKAGETAAEMIRQIKAMGLPYEICVVPGRCDTLQVVRESLFQGAVMEKDLHGKLSVYSTDSVYQECSAAVERIIELVQSGARYRDISIVCPQMQMYQNTLQMIFRRAGIPLYVSGTEGILDKPVITTVISAMEAALGGFEQQDVIRYLKSSLSPLELEICDRVENYTILWGINGKKWLQEWTAHPQGLDGKETEHSQVRLKQLNEARVLAIEPLRQLHDDFLNAKTVRDQVKALYTYLEKVSLGDRLRILANRLDAENDNRSAQILNQLWEILMTAMEQMYDVLGDTVWDAENFTRLFRLLLSQYDVGTIPPVLDAVSVGPVSAMRCQQCKHLFVIGAAEGSLPGYGQISGVLSDQERTQLRDLGVPLTGGAADGLQAEFAEIYGVFCSAEETVSVSYCGAQPSVVHRRLSKLAGGDCAANGDLGDALMNKKQAGAYLARCDGELAAQQLGIADAFWRMRQRVEYVFGSVAYENIKKLYGDVLNLSASQIDKQAQCKMGYFLRYGLHAEERKPAEVDSAEFGTYVHAVMENTGIEIRELGGFRAVSLDKALEIANKYSEEYAQKRFSQIDTQRFTYLFNRNCKELELIVRELWREMQECDFEPVGFELGFGDGEDAHVPAIDVSGANMPARLRGFVDRVDAWECNGNRYFRVVDYKTGRKDFDYCDLFNGYGLQMLLYLFALEDGGEEILGQNLIPAGVQYFPARVPLVSADGKLSDEEAEKERVKLWKRKGLVLSHENVLNAMEHPDTPSRMPYGRNKDGKLTGDVADRHQFALLKSYVFMLVSTMVDEIASGDVTPNPYTRGTSHSACKYCPYASVCHEQDVTGRRNFKAIKQDEFWRDIEKGVSRHG